MMKQGVRAMVALLAAAAMTVSGCGGGSSSTVAETKPSPKPVKALPPPQPIGKREFVDKARKFCAEWVYIAERKALLVVEDKAKLYIRHGDLNQFKGVLKRQEIATMLAPALRWRVKRIRSFGLPMGDEVRMEKILSTIDKAAETAEGAVLKEIPHARVLARSYGIESCALVLHPGGLYERGSAKPGVRLTPRSSK